MGHIIYSAPDLTIEYVPRTEWDASASTERFIRQRYKHTVAEATSLQVHHTASVDRDSTPNRRSRASAFAYQRSLQWARPELGPLPYSHNLALSEDSTLVWLLEGRGSKAVGAHTAGHNRTGIGVGVHGNLDLPTPKADLDRLVRAVEVTGRWLRHDQGWKHLGTEKSPRGWQVWGHRDTSPKSCPGNYFYPRLEAVDLTKPLTHEEVIAMVMPFGSGLDECFRTWNKRFGGYPTGTGDENRVERVRRIAHWLSKGEDDQGRPYNVGDLGASLDRYATPAARGRRQRKIKNKPLTPGWAAKA